MAESLTVDGVMNALRNCYDPEIPVNIVDLGLIYGVAIDDDSVTADVRDQANRLCAKFTPYPDA